MTTSMCLELLRASPTKHQDTDACMILTNIISSFDISIPHPTSPLDPKFRVTDLAEKVFDFSRDCAAAKLINNTPTILLNHQIFDVNREKQDGGNLVERLLLDGELHLSKPPPTPPMLFLIVSADGTQVPLPKDVVEECIKNCSFMTISQLINSWQNTNGRQLMNGDCRKGSAGNLPTLEPLLNFQILTSDIAPRSSHAISMLPSMMHAQ